MPTPQRQPDSLFKQYSPLIPADIIKNKEAIAKIYQRFPWLKKPSKDPKNV